MIILNKQKHFGDQGKPEDSLESFYFCSEYKIENYEETRFFIHMIYPEGKMMHELTQN